MQYSQNIICILLVQNSKLRISCVLHQNRSSIEYQLWWFGDHVFSVWGFFPLHAKQLLQQLLVDKNKDKEMQLCRTLYNLTTTSQS